MSRPTAIDTTRFGVFLSVSLLTAVATPSAAASPPSRPSVRQSPADVATRLFARADVLDRAGSAECLDGYLACCRAAWETFGAGPPGGVTAVGTYNAAVERLIDAGRRYGRFAPGSGLRLRGHVVPVRLVGIAWRPEEVAAIVRGEIGRGDGEPPARPGLGCPVLLAHRTGRPFLEPEGVEPATAVVTFAPDGQASLDVVNPQRATVLRKRGRVLPIGYDMAAAEDYYRTKYKGAWFDGFLGKRDAGHRYGLVMGGPYEPGLIPVVLIHGIASDPTTWLPMLEGLAADPVVASRYQFWFFWYPTGQPFVAEAAKLRRQLVELRRYVDPTRSDPALDRVVLVGHSMGGLIAKLQVTESGGALADTVFNVPYDTVPLGRAADRHRDVFFFEPSRQVGRVVFIGTPHRGSVWADRPVGRLASHIARRRGRIDEQFPELARLDPRYLRGGKAVIPTSVDLLRPANPMLGVIDALPVAAGVATHAVIGVGRKPAFGGVPDDGVVTPASARRRGDASEKFVDAEHMTLHAHPDAIAEVGRILRGHAGVPASVAGPPTLPP